MSLPDTAEYWAKTEPAESYLRKGSCDCEAPKLKGHGSRHCRRCRRIVNPRRDSNDRKVATNG